MVRRFWGAAKSIASADDEAVVVPGGTYDPLGVGGPDDSLPPPPPLVTGMNCQSRRLLRSAAAQRLRDQLHRGLSTAAK